MTSKGAEPTTTNTRGVEFSSDPDPETTPTRQDGPSAARGPRGPRGELRDRIRTTARQAFIENGYEGTTVRRIAREAGCDAALISYYFGPKPSLFRECFGLPSDPASDMLGLLLSDPATAGERLVRHVLALYEARFTADTLSALMRAAFTDATTSQRFRDYIRTDILNPLATHLGVGPTGAEQLELAMAHVYGVVTMRYFLRLEPIASMPRERLVAELAPFIQARLTRMMQGYRKG